MRFIIAEMDGAEADAICGHALRAEAAAYRVQGVIENLEHSRV